MTPFIISLLLVGTIQWHQVRDQDIDNRRFKVIR